MKKGVFKRLMKDFPWLWAICSDWYPPSTDIKVEFADQEKLKLIFTQRVGSRLWVKTTSGSGRLERVIKVRVPEGYNLAQAIKEAVPCGYVIDFIVIESPWVGKKNITIFRPPKTSSFNEFVINLIQATKVAA